MRDFLFILTIICATGAFPLPSAQDIFSDSEFDSYGLSDDSSQPLLWDDSSQPLLSDDSSQPLLWDDSSQPLLWDDSSQPLLSDDSSSAFLLAGSDTGSTNEGKTELELPPGFDPDAWDLPWSSGSDSSWTGRDRPSRQRDGSYQTAEDKFIQGEKGEDYEANYGIVSPDMGAPTNFQLSPEDTARLIQLGTLVVGGVTWVYNKSTGVISQVWNALNGFMPSGHGL